MAGITRELSRYVSSSQFDDLSAAVRHEGVRAFVNWVGCAAGGAREGCVERAMEVLAEFNGAPAATVVGRREKLDALNAACIIHPIIDACLDAARKESIVAAQIERVELTVNPLAVQLCNRPEPKNHNQAMVSFQH